MRGLKKYQKFFKNLLAEIKKICGKNIKKLAHKTVFFF